jgi:hypothetical protein
MMVGLTIRLFEFSLADNAKCFQCLHAETCDFLIVLAAEANWILVCSVHWTLKSPVSGSGQVCLLLHYQKVVLIDDERL